MDNSRLGSDAERVTVLAEHVAPGQSFTQKQAEHWWKVNETEIPRTWGR